MKQPNRRTISVLFVAIALVLAVGPALGAAGAAAPSVQDGGEETDDGITDETEDTGEQDETNETDYQTADAGESQTRITVDRITIDRISTDHVTMENVTIEGLNMTTSAAEAMFGQMPSDGMDVEDGLDNETDDGLDNETDDEQPAEPNATVTFDDQETDGSTVTVQNVNVSEGGFVTIHDSSLLEGETFDSVVGSSEYLEPGEHEDVEVQLFDDETVPGAEFDQDALEDNQTLIAMPHLDTNDNESYDFLETDGEEDGPYTEDGEAVIDDADITVVADEMDNVTDGNVTDDEANVTDGNVTDDEANVTDGNVTDDEEMEMENASVTFEDQETDGSSVVVDNVTVPEGGFVTIHDSELLEDDTLDVALDSVVGTSEYLEPGTHEDVTVELFEGVPGSPFDQDALEDNQTLIAMPHLDTNENETYDFVETEGEVDGPYAEDGEAVIDDADITVVDDEMDNETDDDAEETDNETEMAGDAPVPEGDSYNVSDLEAPETATVGETLDVSAEISNPNDEASNQSVEFRLDGDVVERQYLVLEGGENETVTFEIDSEGLEAGDYNHGILTFDEGEVADISLEEAEEEEAPVDDEEDAEPNATVTFDDQETDGSTVTVQNVNVSEGGFVTIHDSSLLEGETFDSVVGNSEYLEPGEHEDVEVQLFDEETVPGAEFDQDALEDNQTLIAMPHQDTNDNESYDFLETEGEEDGPYTEDGEAVIDDAEITVVEDDADETTDEEDDAPSATLDVADQSGDGTTLEIGEATASEDFSIVANYDGETSESEEFNAVEERLDYTLTLDPPIENDTTVEVAILAADDDEELTSQEIEYDVEEDGDATADETTDGTTNETDGDATGVDDNESAALIA